MWFRKKLIKIIEIRKCKMNDWFKGFYLFYIKEYRLRKFVDKVEELDRNRKKDIRVVFFFKLSWVFVFW